LLPPVLDGALQFTDAWLVPSLAVTSVGAEGGVIVGALGSVVKVWSLPLRVPAGLVAVMR
jgi:hypothetical protein